MSRIAAGIDNESAATRRFEGEGVVAIAMAAATGGCGTTAAYPAPPPRSLAALETADVAGEEWIAQIAGGVEDDMRIWKHKVHRADPVFCEADKELGEFRPELVPQPKVAAVAK